MSKRKQSINKYEKGVLKVERCFTNEVNLTFNAIIDSIIKEEIDSLISESYHINEVNIAASSEEEVV